MKTPSHLLLTVVLFSPALNAQPPTVPQPVPPPRSTPAPPTPLPPRPDLPATIGTVTPADLGLVMVVDPTTGQPSAKPPELRFDLDFPGGSPEALVREIEAAGVGTLNAIIPQDLADTAIPAIRVKSVTVPQLFDALAQASRKTVTWSYDASLGQPLRSYQQKDTSFGFRTQGEPGPDSIWVFYCERPPISEAPTPPKVVRFHQLAPYLDPGGYTVDDITTAVQTGWRMLGDPSPPTLNFHKDTKLLIALGTESQLRMIDEVLAQLRSRTPPQLQLPPTPAPAVLPTASSQPTPALRAVPAVPLREATAPAPSPAPPPKP